jgi:hypothetical protein
MRFIRFYSIAAPPNTVHQAIGLLSIRNDNVFGWELL